MYKTQNSGSVCSSQMENTALQAPSLHPAPLQHVFGLKSSQCKVHNFALSLQGLGRQSRELFSLLVLSVQVGDIQGITQVCSVSTYKLWLAVVTSNCWAQLSTSSSQLPPWSSEKSKLLHQDAPHFFHVSSIHSSWAQHLIPQSSKASAVMCILTVFDHWNRSTQLTNTCLHQPGTTINRTDASSIKSSMPLHFLCFGIWINSSFHHIVVEGMQYWTAAEKHAC